MPIIRAAGSIPESKEKGIQRDTTYQIPKKDYKGRLKEYRTYQKEKKAYETEVAADTEAYRQAELERPVYSRGDTVEGDTVYGTPEEYSQALSEWTTKYSNVLGKGEERYEKEKDFIDAADKLITKEIAYEEITPFGVGVDVNRLLSDKDIYQVVEWYESGVPKKIQAKPKVYTSQTGYRGSQVNTYIPYEATLSEQGKLIEEKSRDVGMVRNYWDRSSGSSTQYTPYEKAILTYTGGLPKELKAQTMYKTGGDSSKGWAYSYYGLGPQTEITFGEGGKLGTKAVYDVAEKRMQLSGEYGKKTEYSTFLDKFYNYGKQEMLDYPTPITEKSLMGSKKIQELIHKKSTKPSDIDYDQYQTKLPAKPIVDYSKFKSSYNQPVNIYSQPKNTYKNSMAVSQNRNKSFTPQITQNLFNFDEFPWLSNKFKKQPVKQFSMVNMDILK